ncbi:MAG: hypothetical protein J6Y11_06980 [Paludibacteraceae bacterium]|nr:hypothetical protein [Paludibacteraceae bacterium]
MNQLVWQFSKPAHHRQGILEKWKFSSKTSWKNGNFSQFHIGKMEILKLKSLEKWKFQPILPWKSGNFEVKKLGKMENFGQKHLGKVEISADFTLKKWKFWG